MADENNPVVPNEDEGGLPPAHNEDSDVKSDGAAPEINTENDKNDETEPATPPPSENPAAKEEPEKTEESESSGNAHEETSNEPEKPAEEKKEEATHTDNASAETEKPKEEEKTAEPVQEQGNEPENDKAEPVSEEVKTESENVEAPQETEEPAKVEEDTQQSEVKVEEEKKEEAVVESKEEKKEEAVVESKEEKKEEPAAEVVEQKSETPEEETKEEAKPEPVFEEREEKEEKEKEKEKEDKVEEPTKSEADSTEKESPKGESAEQEQNAPEKTSEKSDEGEKEAPKTQKRAPKPKAPFEVISRLEHLPFAVESFEGGEHAEFPASNVLLNDREKVYSSVEARNVDLVLKYTGSDKGFVATHVVVRAPEPSFTAPISDGLIFISKEKISESVLRTYNNFTRDDFLSLYRNNKGKNPSELDDSLPVAFFDMTYSGEQLLRIENKPGNYVTLKLLSSSGDKKNIDLEFVGVVGFAAEQAPSEQYEFGRQVIVDMGLITEPAKFTSIKTKEDVRTFQQCLRSAIGLFMVFVNDATPTEIEEYKRITETIANEIEIDDNLSVFFTGEASEMQTFAIQSRPALGFPLDQSPMVAIYSEDGKYVLPANVPVTESSVRDFLNSYKQRTLKPYLKSAKRPEKDTDPKAPGLTICTASSFEEIVFNPEADVFMHYFADYEPIFVTLSRVLSGVNTIVTAQFDLEENDVEKEHFDGLPPLYKLYPKKDKQNPVVYTGPVQGDSLLQFLHEHCEDKFDLAAKQREFELLHPILIEEHKRHADEAKEQIFKELREDPEFTEIRLLLQQRPELAAPLIEQWIRTEPFFARLIYSYGEEFLALLQEPVTRVPSNIRQTPDGRVQISVTPEQMAGIEALMQEGFSKEEVLQAFIECDSDIEAAENFLKHGVMPSPARRGGHGHSHGHGHGHGHGHAHGGPTNRFTPVDDGAAQRRAGASGAQSPLSRTPVTPHPTKKKKIKQSDLTGLAIGVGVAVLIGVGAYFWFSKKD